MRVLVVDDDAGTRAVVHAMVSALGHECLLARDGAEAWRLVTAESVDVVLTDRVMPDMDGLELCRRIRAATPVGGYVYVVLTSALGEDAQARDGMVAGADDYLAKPVRQGQVELKLIAARRVTALHRQLARLTDDLRDRVAREEFVNERLVRANRLQADIALMLGHDIRQPLTLVHGYIEAVLACGGAGVGDEQRALLVKGLSAAERLDRMIDEILTMATLDGGTPACAPAELDAAHAVRQAVVDVAPEGAVAVEGKAALLVDPGHFRQMVHNLVGNALKYGAPPVRVIVEGGGSWTTVVVQDGGAGVAPGYVPHLFEQFTRGPAESSSRSSGTGLGLYLVRRLAEANGGTVRYVPGPSSGAGFVLTLPASASRAVPAMPKIRG